MAANRSSAVMQQRSEPHEVVMIGDAKARGLNWYFTGKPCPHGHVAKRSLSNRDCRACVDARRAAKDASNPDRARARNVRRYHKDIEASRAKVRSAYAKHADSRRAHDAERYHNDADRKASTKRRAAEWGRDNKGKRNAIIAARRARIKKATPRWQTDADRKAIKAIYLLAASYGPGIMEVDHIIPLAGKLVCGLHVPENLQILTAEQNRLKNNQFDSDWIAPCRKRLEKASDYEVAA